VIKRCDDQEPMIEHSSRVLARLIGLALVFGAATLIASVPAALGGARGAAAHATRPLTAQATVRPSRQPDRRRRISRGIVQAVSGRAVVLRQLDGSTRTVPVDARTRVLVNGKRARLADVKPGFVAIAVWTLGRPARELRVLSLPLRHGRAIPQLRLRRPG
jgi:hypothetical protein